MKSAFITDITGQHGAYFAEFLLKKGYFVHGLKRGSSLFNTNRIDHPYQDQHENHVRFKLHSGDFLILPTSFVLPRKPSQMKFTIWRRLATCM